MHGFDMRASIQNEFLDLSGDHYHKIRSTYRRRTGSTPGKRANRTSEIARSGSGKPNNQELTFGRTGIVA